MGMMLRSRLIGKPSLRLFMVALVFGSPFLQAAHAGQVPAAGSTRTVIISDFVSRSKGPLLDASLLRVATDAVAVELAGSSHYDVLRRQEVERAASTLGYRAPYDKIELGKIASTLAASDVVTGEIVAIQASQSKGKPRTVRVALRLKLTDASRGDVVNGAAVIGSYSARGDAESDEAMAREAASRAAAEAVRQIVYNTLPEGIILNTVGGGTSGLKILVNRGYRDGVEEGMEMAVYRGNERLGVIRVTSVSGTYADAEPVVYSLGYRPTDHVRAIFPVPEFMTK